uniref:Uncharacterized protein n=1 Tax=Fagus sylvatica TaxID=28930 RepID=A0A2N9FBM7_FAGSY
MGFVGLHIGSMGPVRPRSDPARLLQASSETICLPRLHQTPSRPQSASVLIYLGFNPNCSASVQTSRPFQTQIWSISPSTQSVSASPSHLGLGLVLHDPSRLRQALLGPERPSSDPICSSSVQTAPSLSDLPLFSPICSSLVQSAPSQSDLPLFSPICPIPVRSAPLQSDLLLLSPICSVSPRYAPPWPRSTPPYPDPLGISKKRPSLTLAPNWSASPRSVMAPSSPSRSRSSPPHQETHQFFTLQRDRSDSMPS